MRSRFILGVAIVGWLVCVALAAIPVVRHQYTPGIATDAGAWPTTSPLRRPTGPTLVLAAHVRCPCAWASLDELAQANVAAPQMRICVLVATPAGVPPDPALAERARQLCPDAEVVADDGAEARRFGVSTSGHALFFDGSGRLRFSGGITASRGHRGDNPGLDAVIALAQGREPAQASAPVYGCALADTAPEATCPRCDQAPTR